MPCKSHKPEGMQRGARSGFPLPRWRRVIRNVYYAAHTLQIKDLAALNLMYDASERAETYHDRLTLSAKRVRFQLIGQRLGEMKNAQKIILGADDFAVFVKGGMPDRR